MKAQSYNLTILPFTEAERTRFWSRVQKTDTCWLWTGARMVNGYGTLSMRGKPNLAHRIAYYLEYGKLPDGLDICHTCDVRQCVNPAHLVPGSRQENLVEMHQKGRWQREKNNPANSFQKVQRTCLNCGTVFHRTISIYREELEPLCCATCRKEWHRRNIAEQFWAKVDRSNPDGCWPWQGRLHINGYGQVGFRGRDRLAHRFAWRLVHGDIPPGLHILHSCDNPSCVNPTHLSPGTRSENMLDASRKGRTRAPRPSLRGELHPNSVLTNMQRQEIRDRHVQGESYGDLVKAFGVGKTTIARVVTGHR